MDDFEVFMRDKIARLRQEADALEKTLKEFQGAKSRSVGGRRRGADYPRAGAFGIILEAISKAGLKGLSLDEMTEVAAQHGYEVKRNTLRSQIWTAKEDGVVVQLGPGHYRSANAADLFDDDDSDPNEVRGDRTDEATARAFGAPATKSAIDPWDKPIPSDLDDEIPF